MNTSILTVVLAGALLAGQNETPTWHHSYTTAQKMGTEHQKPVLVVIGSGANGWSKVIREAAPSPEVAQRMAKYVCCYIDNTTPEGMKLAHSFEITGCGLVMSDRTGAYQAFWHQGDLTNQNLARYLETYADPRLVVQTTATATTVRDSAYPQGTPAAKPQLERIDGPAKPGAMRTPVWEADYSKALTMASSQQKPICMVFCNGANTGKMIGETPSAECMQLLCDKYVCVCVDMTTPAGKKLAQDCGITGEMGMVISDRACMTQAFWHQGALAADAMLRCLTRYCDPQVTVQTTETASRVRTSFYPASTEADAGMSITGSSYCPSCNNARRR